MDTHSSILAWRISWTKEPADCSPWDRKELNTTGRLTLWLIYSDVLVSFRCTAKWFSYTYTYVHSFSDSVSI